MNKGAIVVNPPTTTVTTKTIGLATTITDKIIPAITILPAPSTSFETAITAIWTDVQTHQPTFTLTQTSVGITYYLANTAGLVYSTSTTGWLIAPTHIVQPQQEEHGFNGWPAGAKAGLIIGVVFAALIILWIFVCCYKRNARWIAHDWRWASHVEGGVPGMANANMMAPYSTASPMAIVSTTPSYQYGYPGYAYMRGGAGPKNWFGRLVEKFRKWQAGKKDKAAMEDDATPIRVLREMRAAREKRRYPPVGT